MNTIVIELCAEDRARLDRLADALDRGCSSCSASLSEALTSLFSKAQAAPASMPEPVIIPDSAPQTEPQEIVADAPAPDPVPVVSLAEFQKALTLRCSESPEVKAKVKSLLNQYAAAASAVPPEKRAEILAKLKQI